VHFLRQPKTVAVTFLAVSQQLGYGAGYSRRTDRQRRDSEAEGAVGSEAALAVYHPFLPYFTMQRRNVRDSS